MARLILQTKKLPQKISRIEKGDSSYIPTNDPLMFTLLTDNRCEDEKFSRVDRWMVNHYYLIGTEWLMEKIFYPSEYGIEQLNKEKHHPYIKKYKQLMKKGIGLHGDRPISRISKPIKRLELKCKPKRMALSCKE
jgi:hypothetical protein